MDKLKTRIVISKSLDPAYNLSFEEWLLANVDEETVIMYLWQNQNTVVIGRNQNPWKECRLDLMKKDSVKLVRRLSGGGAVYHDLGNLNFTFVSHKKNYNLDRQVGIIISALKKVGIDAESSGRNDIVIDGSKFSGNAFLVEKNNRMQHGTILIDVDMKALSKYLNVSKLKVQSKGIESVKARVINLKDIDETLTVSKMKTLLVDAFIEEYGHVGEINNYDEESIKNLVAADKYNRWEWNYSDSPSFSIQLEKKFDWGIVDFNFNLKDGKIFEASIYSDALFVDGFREFADAIIGTELVGVKLAAKCEVIGFDNVVKRDIKDFLMLEL
ncbi:MAG: lipoate--protein ligase [Clostridiales bacterium]|nr:lipoate--protein ligase [Clostridiales bacterium]